MATFAEQLTAARKAAGMTQEELSETVHVARNTISNWERGQRQPDLETMRLLGQALHTDFLTGQDVQDETAAEAETASEQIPREAESKKKKWPVLLAAALAVAALGVVLWFALGNKAPSSSYQPAAKLADEAGQLTIEFFQKPVQQTVDMPYLAYSYDTTIEMDNQQSVWFYEHHFRETNGHRFKINQVVCYSFPPINAFTDVFPAERMTEYGIATEIPAYGEWQWNGGFPVQPYIGIGIIVYGEDDHGTEMEFHGYIDYNASLPADAQE